MAFPTIKNMPVEAADYLPHQFKDKVNIQGLMKSIAENVQVIENQNFQLLQERGIYTAIGVQLDNIGLIVGVARDGLGDEAYRQVILAKVSSNTADGTPEAIRTAAKNSTQASKVFLFDHPPASMHITVEAPTTPAQAAGIKSTVPAGVSLRVMFDEGGDSFIPSDLTVSLSRLALENDDLLEGQEIPDTYNFELQDLTSDSLEGRAYLPDLIDSTVINPLVDTYVTNTLAG